LQSSQIATEKIIELVLKIIKLKGCVNFLLKNIDLYLQVRNVNVLAESLIDYRERNKTLPFGFAFVQ
jgi:hypothetical protein